MSSPAEILDGLAAVRIFDLKGVVAVVTGGGTVCLICRIGFTGISQCVCRTRGSA